MRRLALWELGFRPFYLLASVFAALSIALWAAQVSGLLPRAYLSGSAWHAHEMLFGFTMAVIAGFLFTAVRNWTQQPTPTGALLAGFALLWIAGRVLVLTPFGMTAAAVNALFPLALAAGIAMPLIRSGNARNYFFIVLLVAAGFVEFRVHMSLMGLSEVPAAKGLRVGLDLVLFIVAVLAGRVIPMFTNNGVPGAGARRIAWLEQVALGTLLGLLAADLFQSSNLAAAFAAAGAIAHAVRLILWSPWKTLRTPLVWILHASYAWIVFHLALRVAAFAGFVPETVATHALTLGAIGGMTLGMMTRTARGHSGRTLIAGRAEIACYLLIQMAALVRVAGALFATSSYVSTIVVSAACWSLAYAVYAVRYLPILALPRVDGKPG
jgi:uncharacterized protein involved in response to NO